MSDRTCTIEGCDTPERARGWCATHYSRWRRTGTAETGRPYGQTACSQPDCPEPHYCKGVCRAHYAALRYHGDPALRKPRWHGDDIGYPSAHLRIYRTRGKAAAHPCHWCSKEAQQWAYDHADPNEKRWGPKNLPYSTDPAHYLPACRSCHAKFDRVFGG